ncbi:MAG: hypothetical protein H6705_16900 [Myxococcales bacterium]|nr:hypothetical protein [Myxococcales bacterium]
MSVTRRSGSDFSAYLGCAVIQSGANTVALWTDPETVPFGIIDAITEEDPQSLSIAVTGDRTRMRVGAGGIAAGSTFLTTVGATGRAHVATAGEYFVAQNLHAKAGAEGDLVEVIVTVGQLSIAGS